MKDRTGYLGSSDVPAVLGWSSFSTPWDVFAEKTKLIVREDTGNNATNRGNILEPGLLAWYADENKVNVVPGPSLDQDPIFYKEPWLAARPDGIVESRGADGPGVIEIKTVRQFDDTWGPDGTDHIPLRVAGQVTAQLICTGANRATVVAYSPMNDEIRVYRIARDMAAERQVVAVLRGWWQRHVVANIAPPLDASDACGKGIAALYPCARDGLRKREATLEELLLLEDIAKLTATYKQVDELLRERKNRLKAVIGEHPGLLVQGKNAASYFQVKGRDRIDAARFRNEQPSLAETYTTRGPATRSLRVNYKPES